MRNARLLYPALLLSIAASGLQSCSQDPQRQAAQHPHFEPPVDSTEYYAERDAYYQEHPQTALGEESVGQRVYHTATYYHSSPRYYTDPYSVYNNPRAHGFHRSYEEESEYEAGHHEQGSKIGPAVAAGAAGLAAGVAAGYVAGRRTGTPPTASGRATGPSSTALAHFGQTTLARNATATKQPQLLTPVTKAAPPATYRKAPSPVFTVPAPAPARPTVSAPVKAPPRTYSLSATPAASRRTITVSHPSSSSSSSGRTSRSGGFFGSRGRRR